MTVKEFFGEAWHVDANKVEFIFADDNNEEYVFTMETNDYFRNGEMIFKNVSYSAYKATANFYHEVFDNANIVSWGFSDYSGENRMYIVIDFSYNDYIDYI